MCTKVEKIYDDGNTLYDRDVDSTKYIAEPQDLCSVQLVLSHLSMLVGFRFLISKLHILGLRIFHPLDQYAMRLERWLDCEQLVHSFERDTLGLRDQEKSMKSQYGFVHSQNILYTYTKGMESNIRHAKNMYTPYPIVENI
jgi:hypothetical protein